MYFYAAQVSVITVKVSTAGRVQESVGHRLGASVKAELRARTGGHRMYCKVSIVVVVPYHIDAIHTNNTQTLQYRGQGELNSNKEVVLGNHASTCSVGAHQASPSLHHP
jgi:hypothetical protein